MQEIAIIKTPSFKNYSNLQGVDENLCLQFKNSFVGWIALR